MTSKAQLLTQNTTTKIALPFAGERPAYVDKVAAILHALGVRVFYDAYETTDLWGKDLYTYLSSRFASTTRRSRGVRPTTQVSRSAKNDSRPTWLAPSCGRWGCRLNWTRCWPARLRGAYSRMDVTWRLALGEVDGDLAIVLLHFRDRAWGIGGVIRADMSADGRIQCIADYQHCPWTLTAGSIVVRESVA